jgi:HK97 family phage portal protein
MPSLVARLGEAWRTLTRDAAPAATPENWWAFRHGGYGLSAIAGPPVDAHTATGLPAFTACVALISQALASEPWLVERDLPGGGASEVRNGAAAMLGRMTFAAKERLTADCLISGSGFATVAGGDLVALPWENMSLQYAGGAMRYFYLDPMTGSRIDFAPDELLILRYRNWGRLPWLGVPPLLAISDVISTGLAARLLQASEFRNGSKPAGYLSTESKLDPAKAQELGRRWAENYAGVLNSGKTAVLEQGLKYALIEPRNLAELQMAELAKHNDLDVCRAFNVPPNAVGIIDIGNRATSVEQGRLLVSLCLAPMAARVADAVGLYLLSEAERGAGIRIGISLRDLTRGHGDELAQSLSRLVLAGVISRNEARAEIGLPGTSDTDPFVVPVNVETIEQAARRADRQDARAEAQARLEQGLDDLRARHDEGRQMVERLVEELVETRDLAKRAIAAAQRPALSFSSANLANLPPPPEPPPAPGIWAEIELLLRDGSIPWRKVDALWAQRIEEADEIARGYDIEVARWQAECARIEAAAANDDQAGEANASPAFEKPSNINIGRNGSEAFASPDPSGLVASIQAGVFGRMAAELLRARSDVAREQIAEVGEALMAELRRQLTAERRKAAAEKREAGAMEAVDELGAVEGFRAWLDERRLVP